MPTIPITITVAPIAGVSDDSIVLLNRTTKEKIVRKLDYQNAIAVFDNTEFTAGITAADVLEVTYGGTKRLAPGTTYTATVDALYTPIIIAPTLENEDTSFNL